MLNTEDTSFQEQVSCLAINMTTNLIDDISNSVSTADLPDVNAETYPFDVVQRNLDQAAFISLFAVADRHQARNTNNFDPDDWFDINGGYGLNITSALHRFDATFEESRELKQALGEQTGTLRLRLLYGPEATEWVPGSEPSPRVGNPWQSQRFVTNDLKIELGDGSQGFLGYAMGRTYPVTINGRPQVVVCAVGNLFAGFGKLADLKGTICLQGSLTPDLGFQGNVTCRIVDPDELLSVGRSRISSLKRIGVDRERAIWNCDAATYITLRGEKENRTVRTEYGPSPAPGLVSLVTPADMKAVKLGLRARMGERIQADMRVGHVVARLKATVGLDILAPPGTPERPNDFNATDIYTFMNRNGEAVGTITARVETGKAFDLQFPKAPGQPGMRFGGCGPILKGTGVFDGVQGTLTMNSAIGVAPHALSLLHVLRIIDPDGFYRRQFLDADRNYTRKKQVIRLVKLEPASDSHFGARKSAAKLDNPQQLPDLNQETYPFHQVLGLLDKAAFLSFYSVPDFAGATPILGPRNRIVGFRIHEVLHRFHVALRPSTAMDFPNLINSVGETIATMCHTWMFIPDNFYALPNSPIPPTPFTPDQPQRFVMHNTICRLNSGIGGFYGFGTGRTSPTHVNGRRELVIGAVCNVVEGFGVLADAVGTYTYCGTLCPQNGYRGSVLCRVTDLAGSLRARKPLATVAKPVDAIEAGAKYVVFRGQKRDQNVRTTYSFDKDGAVDGLNVQQQLHALDLDCTANGSLQCQTVIGDVIGDMSANVRFNVLDPGAPGTGLSPIPFQSVNQFRFTGPGGESIGGFDVDGGEGRTFNLTFPQAPGQQALRFGVFAPMVRGAGVFSGIQGVMTDNSAIGVAPHAVSTCYLLRLA